MKKLFLIFILCALSLYGIMVCYADIKGNAVNIIEDLPLALKYEPAESLRYLFAYSEELQHILEQQRQSLNTLNYIYYLGSFSGTFDGRGLYNSVKWEEPFDEKASLFNSEVYKGYYKVRTEKILKQYQTSEAFDDTAFTKSSKHEFDSYINAAMKDQKSKDELLTTLQSKLAEKLIELEPDKRKAMFDEILALRQAVNSSNGFEHLFQLYESRVRLQLTRAMIDLNKQKLEKLCKRVGIAITSEAKGQLLLQSKSAQSTDQTVLIMNVLENEEGYRGLAYLHELYSKQDAVLIFEEENGIQHIMGLEEVIASIEVDENGFMHLKLDSLFTQNPKEENHISADNSTDTGTAENRLQSLELLYKSKTKTSQEIIRQLNRYSIYLELKDQKISNYYTRSFESNQKSWKKNMESLFNSFGAGGMADFMVYIKQFEQLDRNGHKADGERSLIAKYRNSDLQFRKTEEGSYWITNMLFKLKTLQ